MAHICNRKVCVTLTKLEEMDGIAPKIPCERCGFNPEEQKRRLSEGRFTEDGVMVINHREMNDGRNDQEVIYNLKHLVFPRKAEAT